MISPQSYSKHYLLSSGKLTEKINQSNTPTPKIIHYQHKVRIITPFVCDHETSTDGLSKQHKLELQQKNNQINKLKKIVEEKQALLIDKENLIVKLQEKQKKQKVFEPKAQKLNQTQSSRFTNSFIWSSVSERKIEQIQPDVKFKQVCIKQNIDQQIQKVNEQMKNTISSFSNITNLLEKPRKKYKFYFEDFQLQEHKKQQVVCQKRLSETTINHFQNDSLNQTFIQSIQNEYVYQDQLDFIDIDHDQTSAEDNIWTQSFLQDVIKQHKTLKQNLIELEESTNRQILQMKDYYQKEIQMYIQLLNSQKKTSSKFNLDSQRTNFSSEQNLSSSQKGQRESFVREIFNKDIIDQRQYPPDF